MADDDGAPGSGPPSGEDPTTRLPRTDADPAQAFAGQDHRQWSPHQNPTQEFTRQGDTQQLPQQGGPQQSYAQEAPHGYAQYGAPGPWQGNPQAGPAQGPSAGPRFGPAASAFAGQSVRRVRSMPWQERVMRVPGGLAVLAGLLTLLSCLFSWWAVFDRSTGGFIEYSLAPFRGVSVSSGSRWSDMAALNSLDPDEMEAIRAITMYVGIMLVVAALCLVAGGLLVALGRSRTLGVALMLLGTVFLGYARIPAEMVGNVADAVGEATSGFFGSADLLGGLLSAFIPEARLGLGLSTLALVLMAIALLVYLGMIIYREFIRIGRWTA